jgi:hypothetical protein
MVFPTFGQVCAFCGAAPFDPNQRADSELEDLDEWELYDETVLPTEETVWMGDTQLIGENPNSERSNKLVIRCPGRDWNLLMNEQSLPFRSCAGRGFRAFHSPSKRR